MDIPRKLIKHTTCTIEKFGLNFLMSLFFVINIEFDDALSNFKKNYHLTYTKNTLKKQIK